MGDNSGVSESDKQLIRHAEKVSQGIVKAYYCYVVMDIAWTIFSYRRKYGHNSHSLNKQFQKGSFLLALRLFTLYEASEYASMWYLVKQTEHLVKRNHPLKDQFKD